MNGAQLIYLRDISEVPPDTQMELRQIALTNMYPSMTAHLAASMKLGDMRYVIEQMPYEELLAQWNGAEADTLSHFFKGTAANYTDDPNQVDLYQGYRISDLGQLDDLISSCQAMRRVLNNAAYADNDKSADVILRAIEMNLPVPFEMLKQVDFKDYRAFLERTIEQVQPILKLDRLYPDPIMFRLTW
jgi:hypothetical protein